MQTQKLMEFAVERHMKGDLDAASEVYCKVLREQPDFADAWNLSGVVAHQMGQHDNGIEYISHAISLRDNIPAYHLNLATALMASKRAEQAEAVSRKCLELDPKNKLAWNVLGNALQEQHAAPEAIQCFERAIKLDKNHVDTWVNLGQVYRKTNCLEMAEKCTQRSLRIDARHPAALNNMGAIRRSQGRDAEALPLFEQALQQQPNAPKTLVNKGNTLQDLGRYKEAETAFLKAIEIAPTNANAWNSLGFYYGQLVETADAMQCYRNAIDLDPKHSAARSNYLFQLNIAEISREECCAAHIATSKLMSTPKSTESTNDLSPNKRLRIGYVSPDFRRHPLVSFFEPMLMQHSQDEVEVFCYANVSQTDDVTDRLQSKSSHWRSIDAMPDADVLTAIQNDKIDILIDLAGHTANNRLSVFAQRAAPVQVSMLGYLNTTGLATMDYLVTDEIRDPEAEDKFYTENIIRLAGGGCCWAPADNSPDVQPPPMIERGYVTFGCTHRPNKLTDRTLELWSQILKAVPNSRLMVFHNMLKKSQELQGHLLSRFLDAGIDADRIDLTWHDENQYLIAYEEMDILLEVVPWSSGTTALESFWQGVPIPTLYGKTPCGRATASALQRLGLSNLVATDDAEYIQTVQQLANDPQRLVSLRSSLRTSMQQTICDSTSFTQQLESSFRQMWKRVCDAV